MLNVLSATPSMPAAPQMPGANAAPFQWLPSGVAFVRRRLWPIVGCGALGLALGVGFLCVATPQYTAIATISIDPGRAHPVGGQQTPADWQSESAYIESQVELIHSPATLRGVVTQLHLDRNPMFAPTDPGPIGRFVASVKHLLPGLGTDGAGLDATARAQALAGATLTRMLVVWRVGTTSVVEVRVHTPDRALSAQLANAVTEAYMAQQLVAISDTTRRAGTWLQSRIGELRGQAVNADRAVQEYKAQHNIVDVATSAGIGLMNEQQLGALNEQVATARSRVATAQARYEEAQAGTVDGGARGMITDEQPNSVMTGLRQQYLDATRREADLTARMGPTHGAVILQHKAVIELQHSIQNELARETEAYRTDYAVAQANLVAIQARLTEQVGAAAKINIERSELRSLQSSADAYRLIYQNFLQRFTQAMQDQSYPISDARVAAPALAPLERSYPRASLTLVIAMMLGLTLGVIVAVAREALDVTVRTVAQLRAATGLECLGVVPLATALKCRLTRHWRRTSRNSAKEGHLQVPVAFRQAMLNPESGIGGAVHGVRVAMARQSALGRDVKVIGCVSMLGDEGTSTFAANLAFALAADGERTALIDWNTQAPWLTQVLSPGEHFGVQDLAAQEATLLAVSFEDLGTRLRFVGQSVGGRPRFQPGAAKIRGMLADLRDRHDVVVLDLPPMQTASAAVLLSDVVDGFVLLARWGTTPQPLLAEALARTAAVDALFLGAVLTHCDPARMRLYPSEPAQSPSARLPLLVSASA
jgi:succinoglycan biosynthesis transport protein ExoP